MAFFHPTLGAGLAFGGEQWPDEACIHVTTEDLSWSRRVNGRPVPHELEGNSGVADDDQGLSQDSN